MTSQNKTSRFSWRATAVPSLFFISGIVLFSLLTSTNRAGSVFRALRVELKPRPASASASASSSAVSGDLLPGLDLGVGVGDDDEVNSTVKDNGDEDVEAPVQASGRVALCLTGNIRTFYFPVIYNSILENVTGVINRTHKLDVFFNVRLRDSPAPGHWSPPKVASDDEVRAVMRAFNPVVVYELGDADEYKPDQALNAKDRLMERPSYCLHTGFTDIRPPFTLWRHAQCEARISAYEKQHGVRYDFVYVMRPDMAVLEPILAPTEIRPKTLYSMMSPHLSTMDARQFWIDRHPDGPLKTVDDIASISDQIIIGDRKSISVATMSYNITKDCDIYNMSGQRNPEAQLTLWTMANNVSLAAYPWLMGIARFQVGIECIAFKMYKLESETASQQLADRCWAENGRRVRAGVWVDPNAKR